MPDDTDSQGNEVEEVIVVVPEQTAGADAVGGTSTGEAATASESGSVTEEIIDVILDPLAV